VTSSMGLHTTCWGYLSQVDTPLRKFSDCKAIVAVPRYPTRCDPRHCANVPKEHLYNQKGEVFICTSAVLSSDLSWG
jgi:hypothetical protein